MKAFKIRWQNCFMEYGVTVVTAKTKSQAEKIFARDFGSDYIIFAIN